VVFLADEFGLLTEDGSLQKAVLSVPTLLSMSLEDNLRPKAHFFKVDLGFSASDCKKLVRLSPVVLALSLDARLLPLVAYLQAELGLSTKDTKKVLLRFPRLPTYNLDSTIRPRVTALRKFLRPLWQTSNSMKGGTNLENFDKGEPEYDTVEQKCIASVLCRCPGLLAVPLEKKLTELNESLALHGDMLRKATVGLPALLTYSVGSNLLPKVIYLTAMSGSDRTEVVKSLSTDNPIVFSLSLLKRLDPRCRAILVAVGINPSEVSAFADQALQLSHSTDQFGKDVAVSTVPQSNLLQIPSAPVEAPRNNPAQLLALMLEAALLKTEKFEKWIECLEINIVDGHWKVPMTICSSSGFVSLAAVETPGPQKQKRIGILASGKWEATLAIWKRLHQTARSADPAGAQKDNLKESQRLDRWLKTQRKDYSAGILIPQRIERLLEANVDLSPR